MGLISALKYVWDNKAEITNLVSKEREEAKVRKIMRDEVRESIAGLKLDLCKFHKGSSIGAVIQQDCAYCRLVDKYKRDCYKPSNWIRNSKVLQEVTSYHINNYYRLKEK